MTRTPPEAGLRWRWLGLALLLWAIDQAVKYQVAQSMHLYEVLPIVSGFNWVYVLNPGAAFSFLADAGGWQRYFFSLIAIAVSGVLVMVLWQGKAPRIDALPYTLLLAGALGNATDRIRIGAVVDYIDLYWRTWHWPAFNIADICVSVAALLLIANALRSQSVPPKTGKSHAA